MSRPIRTIPLCGALIGGLAIGWGAAFVTQEGATTQKVASAGASPPAAPFPPEAANPESNESADAEKLAPDSPQFLLELRAALQLTDGADRDIRLDQLVNGLAPADFGNAYLVAASLGNAQAFLMALGERWGKVDPEGAANFGAAHHADQNFLAMIGNAWATAAPKDAIAWIERVAPQPGHGELTFLIMNVVGKVVENDPRAAVDLWKHEKAYVADWVKSNYEKKLFGTWAKQDPRAAATAALDVHGADQKGILTAVAAAWAQKDVQGGFAWASQVHNTSARKTLTREIALSLAEIDPAAAITWARSSGEDFTREKVFDKAIPKLAAADMSVALAALADFPAGKEKDASTVQLVEAMASKNLDGATQLFEQLPPGPERNRAALAVCGAMDKSDPHSALDWLVAQGALSAEGAKGMIDQWLNSSPDDAVAWAQALPDGANREAALGALADGLAGSDATKAKAFFQQLPPDGQDDVSSEMTKTFYTQDAAQARQWAESLPPGNAQANALNTIAGEWYKQDPAAVAQWLNTLPSGQGRDSAVSGYSEQLANTSPANALTCALTIEDELDRNSAIENVARVWLRTDVNAARSWITSSSDLSDAQKEHLLKR